MRLLINYSCDRQTNSKQIELGLNPLDIIGGYCHKVIHVNGTMNLHARHGKGTEISIVALMNNLRD